ncbi:MAG: uroporphyrinogen-III synthase [Bacteroidales bacterium]|nr:uroporphyrinogen-III synthase [Bacteroidales bacterium]
MVITTQPVNQAGSLTNLLEDAGAKVYNLPMIEIVFAKPDKELICIFNSLNSFDLLIFTSKNGVTGFFKLLESINGNYQIPNNIKIGVIGESTAKEVGKFNQNVDYTNSGITSDEFFDYLIKEKILNANSRLLLALGNLAPNKLQSNLNEIGFAERINVYNTIKPDNFNEKILSIAKNQEADLTVFTSPSAFNNFIQITGFTSDEYKMKTACIGKTTESFIKSKGYNVDLVASNPVIESFAQEIITYL